MPVLSLHGAADLVSPSPRPVSGTPPRRAEQVVIAGGRRDALNDVTHRTSAATIILFLERLRLGPGRPAIAVRAQP